MIELSIIVPSFNECENIPILLEKLRETLGETSYEVIVVDDDSPDGTSDLVRQIAQEQSNVRCLQRVGRRGLSSACIEGMLGSIGPYVLVMDADLQHDERIIPQMLQTLKDNQSTEVVVGSRYIEGGGTGEWSAKRVLVSQVATKISQVLIRAELSDPMSGFFMLTRDFLNKTVHHLSGKGFKILLDLCASSPTPVQYREVPYEFRTRQHGESKLDTLVIWEYFLLLLDKMIGNVLPVQFLMFLTVGSIGVGAHFLILWMLFKQMNSEFITAQMVATVVAMTANFILNNWFTYHDQRLKGPRLLKGLISFYIACGIGALANFYIASSLFNQGIHWVLAGLLGLVVGAVWNYSVTSTFTWKK